MFLEIDRKASARVAAISSDGLQITYGELVKKAGILSGMIGMRKLVFVLCRNRIGSLAAYVSLLSSGNVPLLLSADLDEELLCYLFETYRPEYVWHPEDMQVHLQDLCREKNSLVDAKWEEINKWYGYVLSSFLAENIVLHDDLALLLTTSGSTGSPKLVRQSLRNIESNAASIAEYLELDENERPITMLPMNYTYGLSVINSHLLVGATILMTEGSYAQKPFWDFFKFQKATSIVGVPYTYEILKKLRFFRMELPSLKYMTQAGGKLLPELHREYAEYAERTGRRFYVMYGQTEATARMSYLPFEKSLEKYGSMGIAIPGGKFYLIDMDGNVIETPDTVGELVYEGPNVTLGYAECIEDLRKGDERNGRLVTGDMARRDADGFYYIVGRKKRFLKIYGNRVNLDECERMLQGQFPGMEFACVGRDDHMRIFVTAEEKEREIIDFMAGKTGLNFKAFEVCFIPEIPKNASGKKSYAELSE